MRYGYNTLFNIEVRAIICQVVAYGWLKTRENFKLLSLKVVAVAYAGWSLTRGSKYSDLTCKLLVFWKTGRLGKVVAYERWSQPEVRMQTLFFQILVLHMNLRENDWYNWFALERARLHIEEKLENKDVRDEAYFIVDIVNGLFI